MKTDWFRIPETGDGSDDDPKRPDYVRSLNLDYSGTKSHPDGAPKFVVKVKGNISDLEELASKPGVKRLSNIPVNALNGITGLDKTEEEWEEAFQP